MNNPAYVIPVSIPIPANDEYVFRKLSSESLVSTPDGFTLVDVCLLNASVAASVGNNRTSQIWRLLAVSIQEEFESGLNQGESMPFNQKLSISYPKTYRRHRQTLMTHSTQRLPTAILLNHSNPHQLWARSLANKVTRMRENCKAKIVPVI